MTSLTQEAPTSIGLSAQNTSSISISKRVRAFVARLMAGRELSLEENERIRSAYAERERLRRRAERLMAEDRLMALDRLMARDSRRL